MFKKLKLIKKILLSISIISTLFFIVSCSLDPGSELKSSGSDMVNTTSEHQAATKASPTFQYPSGFTVNLWLKSNPSPNANSFYRYIRFKNKNNALKDVQLLFTRNPNNSLIFTGQITSSGMSVLKTMTYFGNRSFWDNMYLLNKGGAEKLSIDKLNVIAVYNNVGVWNSEDTDTDPRLASWNFKQMQLANVSNLTLSGGGTYSATIYTLNSTNEYSGRLQYINSLMNTSYSFSSFTPVAKSMIRDIGKSGSDPDYKYGQDTIGYMCSETISFYYKDANITYGNDTFNNIVAVSQMADIFRRANRFYGFHLGLRRFQKMDASNNWILPYDSNTYTPRNGDYLARLTCGNEHSMMVVKWDEASDEIWVLEGCHPVGIRRINLYTQELNEQDYAVGRVY
ncbi:MAG: hypothetical protein JXR70_17110 [Spirochaetales bacterium]|nr:hypothetical protein [Spirochaetales bacterium]